MTRQGCKFPAGLAAAIAMTVLPALPAGAADLGVRGATWPIAEPDLLEQIEARLSVMQHSGELARIERDARSRARSRLEEPDPVPGIAPATESRSARCSIPRSPSTGISGMPDGTLIAAAGTRINPLARVPLTRDLLFVDGRRDAEIDWALNRAKPAKIVLLAGRPLDLMRAHGRAFFFDRGGRLAARFGLRFTPALVEQAGTKLRISEIPVEDRDAPGSAGGPPGSPRAGGAGLNPNRRTERC